MKSTLGKAVSLLLCAALLLAGGTALAEDDANASLSLLDMTRWQYNAEHDFYWQTGLSYCANPADPARESMGFFVPGAYMTATANGDGTYTCSVNPDGQVGGYTAQTAPIVLPVNTPGYAAMAAPTDDTSSCGYGSISDFTDAGFVLAFAGARGRDAGAPAGVTDFKAAIRYTRLQEGLLPGNMEAVFTLGMSGGGAQSALLGATGDAPGYEPYLMAIGAAEGVSDAVMGSMCWCPITNLDVADAAYEWNMGVTRTGLSEAEQALSDGLAEAYAAYINDLGLKSADGQLLTLEPSAEGIWQAGSYYDLVLAEIETSLNNFLADTTFPYEAGGSSGGRGGFGGGRMMDFPAGEGPQGDKQGRGEMPGGMPNDLPEGEMPGGMPNDLPAGELPGDQAGPVDYTQLDGIDRTAAGGSGVTLSGVYETAEDYIAALNAAGEWVTYDAATNTATVRSVADFARALKNASKSVGAFDDLNRTQGENILFGYGDGQGAHFDAIMAGLLTDTEYAATFAEDLARTDALGNTVDARVDLYNPMYYLCEAYAGYETSTPARYWRIRTGINQGDTAVNTELNLALALQQTAAVEDVDFAMVWGQAHVEAERTGTSTANFIAWVNACMAE
ncbi:MAG: subtype A tannase [Aristaeellaceae bacterium]